MVVGLVAGQEVIVKHIDHDARIPARYSLGTLLGSANHGVCIGEPINCSMQQNTSLYVGIETRKLVSANRVPNEISDQDICRFA
jgi:hypothetical protein